MNIFKAVYTSLIKLHVMGSVKKTDSFWKNYSVSKSLKVQKVTGLDDKTNCKLFSKLIAIIVQNYLEEVIHRYSTDE